MDCLAVVGGQAAWEGEEGWVGGGAVEAVQDGEGELADCGVAADGAEGEETCGWELAAVFSEVFGRAMRV